MLYVYNDLYRNKLNFVVERTLPADKLSPMFNEQLFSHSGRNGNVNVYVYMDF